VNEVNESAAAMPRDDHSPLLDLRSEVVNADERRDDEHDDTTCPACGIELRDDEQRHAVCRACDARFERHLVAWLDFAAIRDEA
jgi:hypothetical protein